jgi:NAD(P)-dependent dehydrogenase (short-subunit alcohol dehydrogenase family)
VSFRGKTALVTGAASGIGKETARRFAQKGARVICADKNGAGAAAAAADIGTAGGVASGVTLDVTEPDQVSAVICEAAANGGIDILVNNAGITIVGSVETLTPAQWDSEFDINLKSIYLMSNAVWPHFKAKQSGVILNTASIAGQIGIAQDAAYCASKAAVIMLTRCMAVDGAADRIRVNCVCPGFIDTPMIEGFFNDQEDPAAARAHATKLHPLGRLGLPADIANGFVFLASDEAEWVTGTALTIDGGLTAALPAG